MKKKLQSEPVALPLYNIRSNLGRSHGQLIAKGNTAEHLVLQTRSTFRKRDVICSVNQDPEAWVLDIE